MERQPGESMHSGKTPAQRAAERIVADYQRLNDAVTRREEWMCVQAIVNGAIPVIGEGVNETVDFGFGNKVELTGTAQWGKASAKTLDNLEDWTDKVLTEGFANVDTVIMGKAALRAFLADEAVMKALDNRRVEMGLISPKNLPNGVRYIGHLNKPNVDIYTYAEVYYDDWTDPAKPATNPLVPDNKVILISSVPNFVMAYGRNTYIDDKTGLWVTAEGTRLFRSYVEHKSGAPRWRNREGKVEKLVTLGSPSATAMHSTIWPYVEPEVEAYLLDRLDSQVEKLIAKAKAGRG